MITFNDTYPEKELKNKILIAAGMREKLFNPLYTNAYRLVHGEGDGIPGLTIDRYADCFVLQVSTAGVEKLKEHIIKTLVDAFSPRCIYEKSNMPSRREE
jgi:23S rRNA (cytosine1962-C5)-methyltransferase